MYFCIWDAKLVEFGIMAKQKHIYSFLQQSFTPYYIYGAHRELYLLYIVGKRTLQNFDISTDLSSCFQKRELWTFNMVEKRQGGTTYASIMKDLKAEKYLPIYILMGDESYYIDKIADFITEHALQNEEKDFDLSVVFGSDVTVKQVIDLARRYPMIANRQVVVVKEAQNLKNTEALETYLKNPMMSTVLVWCHKNGTMDRRKKSSASAIALASQIGVVFESKKLRDRELPAFISAYLKAHRATIEEKAALMIADHVGADLSRLTSELDKLLVSFADGDRRVTPEIVERQIGVSKDFNAFELKNAIINKNVFKANQIIKYFDTNTKAGTLYSFLPMLFKYFQNLMIAYYSPNRGNETELQKFLELPSPWAVKDYITGMRNYPALKTMQIIYKIREIDAKSKGLDNPNTSGGELMKELIFFILH